MPHLIETRDAALLESLFQGDPGAYAYHLGDLDEPYWSRTRWFLWMEGGGPRAALLSYDNVALLAVGPASAHPALRALIAAAMPQLPESCHLHLMPGFEDLFAGHRTLHSQGEFRRMVRPPADLAPPQEPVEWLAPEHEAEARALYAEAYPGNWFDPRMLATGLYAAARGEDGRLAAIAGIHVASEARGVAALGNIATHPAHRGRGLATRVTRALVARLGRCTLALNVRAENGQARACYMGLGFRDAFAYCEHTMAR